MSLGAITGFYSLLWIIGINVAIIFGKMPRLIRLCKRHKIALTIAAISFLGSAIFFLRSLV